MHNLYSQMWISIRHFVLDFEHGWASPVMELELFILYWIILEEMPVYLEYYATVGFCVVHFDYLVSVKCLHWQNWVLYFLCTTIQTIFLRQENRLSSTQQISLLLNIPQPRQMHLCQVHTFCLWKQSWGMVVFKVVCGSKMQFRP